jgi:hypothetical protein
MWLGINQWQITKASTRIRPLVPTSTRGCRQSSFRTPFGSWRAARHSQAGSDDKSSTTFWAVAGLRTLFAPRDEAFQPPASADPEEYLNGHLLTGASETFDLSRCTSIKSLAGETLPVSDGGMRVGPARIVRADIPCTNGVIHIVDAELQAANAT